MTSWNSTLTALNNRLSNLYFTSEEARNLLIKAGIDPGEIRFTGAARTDWFYILYYVNNTKQISQLLNAVTASDERGKNDEFLKGLLINWHENLYPIEINSHEIENTINSNLEKIMGQQSTLLPISFLEQGLLCSRAVVRIQVNNSLGSGFLIANNYIITNHHVIADDKQAAIAKIQFNYQTDFKGNSKVHENWSLDPTNGFITNAIHDYTLIKITGDANQVYGCLTLAKKAPIINDFVNIIQHPMGGPKQIALYHNIITFVDDNVLQYLTDTMPGSSGSPVFNSDWEVVALHRAGGKLSVPGTSQTVVRNEGTNIQQVRQIIIR